MLQSGNTMNDPRNLRIGERLIGFDMPTYIIAEIGINHNGSVETAKKLIDVAADAGVDAVKFQKRHLPSLYKEEVLFETNKFEQHFQYMIPVLKECELSENSFIQLKNYAEQKKIEFLCTPFDIKSVLFLEQLGVKAYKIASADLTNVELIKVIIAKKKPIILSTGMSFWQEIQKTVQLLKEKNASFALLHCRSSYPVWPREVNLKMINRLKQFGHPVGYSGHDIGITIPLIAASMGACIIEKHITLDKHMRGPDHKISLEPHELKRLVRDIKVADQAMGTNSRFLLRGEILNRELFGKSLIASRNIQKGEIITAEMIAVKGPGKGLAPNNMESLVGKRSNRSLDAGDFFLEEDLDSAISEVNFSDVFSSKWGLIARFYDFEKMLIYQPKVIEFHMTERDLDIDLILEKPYTQELIIHVPEYIGEKMMDLCSQHEDIRTASIDLVQRTIDLCIKLRPYFQGIPKVIAHPGAMSLNAKLDKVSMQCNLHQSLASIDSKGTELLLENLPPYPWYFGGQWKGNFFMSPREIIVCCERYGARFCLDLSHAALYCNAKNLSLTEFIKEIKPYIGHIHIADAYGLDGEGVQIGEGDINFQAVMSELSDYKGTWAPEIWRGHLNNGKGFVTALNRLKQYYL